MANEPISLDELTEVLAEATGASHEEIEEGAESIDIEPPQSAVTDRRESDD